MSISISRAGFGSAIDSGEITDATIVAADLAANSVDSSELVDGSIDTSHFSSNAVSVIHTGVATTSSPTTTSGTYATIAQMTVTADFGGNPCIVLFQGTFEHSVDAATITIGPFLEASAFTGIGDEERFIHQNDANFRAQMSFIWTVTPAAGSKTIDVRWKTSESTATAYLTQRQLIILEMRA